MSSPLRQESIEALATVQVDMRLALDLLAQELEAEHAAVGNGDIVVVINHNRGPVTATDEIGVPPDASLDRLRELTSEIVLTDTLFTGPAVIEGVTALEAARMVVRVAAPARPGRAPEAELVLRQTLGEMLRKSEGEIR